MAGAKESSAARPADIHPNDPVIWPPWRPPRICAQASIGLPWDDEWPLYTRGAGIHEAARWVDAATTYLRKGHRTSLHRPRLTPTIPSDRERDRDERSLSGREPG